jgi:hypothetical protein
LHSIINTDQTLKQSDKKTGSDPKSIVFDSDRGSIECGQCAYRRYLSIVDAEIGQNGGVK